MSRLRVHTDFETQYPASLAGLVAAEHELVRLTAMHTAYAAQPNITPCWQGYIDQKHAAVARQKRTVTALTAAALNPENGLPRARGITSPPTG